MKQSNFNTLMKGIKSFLPISDLRPAQKDIFDEFLSRVDENLTKGFFDLATGFGKTRMMNVLTEGFLSQNPKGKVVVVVPTQSLVKDENGEGMIKRFQDFHQMYYSEPLSIGAFYTYGKDTASNVIVTTYSSLNAFVNKINPNEVGLLLLDEAHHSLSEKRMEAIKEFSNACCYGLTATPAYSPDKSLENLLGSVIAEMNTVQAVKDGLLTPCKNVLLSSKIKVDLSSVSKTRTGEYDEAELEKLLSQALKSYQENGNAKNWKNVHELIANEIAMFYQNYVDETVGKVQGKKCMINCRSQAEAKLQARALNKLFGKTVAGTWTTDTKDKTILNKFVNGNLPILCQVGKLSEGFDMPELDMCINYPTCSRVVEAQRGGRVLRLNPENENKFALIVDVVFAHPDYDNPILSSHENGQVLYRDITNKSVIISDKKMDERSGDLEPWARKERSSSKLSLEVFDIFSNVEELITLENEAADVLKEQDIPLKREGMKASSDLKYLLGKRDVFLSEQLKKYHDENKMFEVDGIQYPLVEKVRSGSKITLALHEHENALETFKKLLGLDKRILKREGMKSSSDLALLLKKSKSFFREKLQKCYDENKTFEVEGVQYQLVVKVLSGRKTALALHEDPQAFETFKMLLEKDCSLKREGMKSSKDLAVLFQSNTTTFKEKLQKCYDKNKTFEVDGIQYPLVEKVKSGTLVTLALHEHENALAVFKKFLETEGVVLYVPLKREGMKSSVDLVLLFKKGSQFFAKKLKKCYDENRTFKIDGIQYPLTEKVRSAGQQILALHEHSKALETFKQLLLQEGIVLEERKITSQKQKPLPSQERQKSR
ncbi:MAG: DEAD/DEAH box helicase family protein [Alphaproteobacteria bacterium]|nr:DEAD/DEAH box helicase family protein [Alphaproteobacteria bacterium]